MRCRIMPAGDWSPVGLDRVDERKKPGARGAGRVWATAEAWRCRLKEADGLGGHAGVLGVGATGIGGDVHGLVHGAD